MPTMKLTTDPGWQLQAEGSRLRLDIYDVIGKRVVNESEIGVSAHEVQQAMGVHKGVQTIDVHINSPGGSAFDGITMYNMLAQHEAKVIVHIDGVAASAASIVAMAGDEIRMAENAMMMIHSARTTTHGNAKTHRDISETLAKMDQQLVTTYARRTDNPEDVIRQQMEAETWFTAREAVDAGFADTIVASKRIAACFDSSIFNDYQNAPADVAERFTNKADANASAAAQQEISIMDITPEAFAEQYPDAVNDWKAEGVAEAKAELETAVNEAKTKGFDEGTDTERGRVQALVKAFGKYPTFLAEQIKKGHDVAKAKAEAFDAKLGLDDGHDGIQLDGSASLDAGDDTDKPDDKTAKLIERAKGITNEYARNAYCASVGLDPALVTD